MLLLPPVLQGNLLPPCTGEGFVTRPPASRGEGRGQPWGAGRTLPHPLMRMLSPRSPVRMWTPYSPRQWWGDPEL